MKIHLSELNEDNWFEAANLSVSEQQKNICWKVHKYGNVD